MQGHFVSKDFVHWAALPVAIWNGLDSSVWPPKVTPYDNEAIFTGSGVLVDGAAPDGKGKGIVQIYPGLCNKDDWPSCSTGTLLAQASRRIASRRVASHRVASHRVASHRIASHRIASRRIASHRIA